MIPQLDTLACPNPWCNSHKTTDSEIRAMEAPILMPDPSGERYAVACPVCPIPTSWQATEREAHAAWNTRDNLPAIREQADEVERLRQIIRRMKGEAEDRPRQPDEAYSFFAMRMVKRLDAIESMANAALNPTQENGNG